jgi:hypothetical protein
MIKPTEQEKINIYDRYNKITHQNAVDDFNKLKKIIEDGNFNNIKPKSRIGNKIVNYFTEFERLNTLGRYGDLKLNYFDFVVNKDFFLSKPSMINAMKYTTYKIEEKILQQLFALYCHQPMIFTPYNVCNLILRYNPKIVLDFTMGWGGRLVGCCACGIEKYIGIEMNVNLKNPYDRMVDIIKSSNCRTEIELYFQDCLTIDYSTLDYDFVFTSPPYYDIEIYNNTNNYNSIEEWNNLFYIPLITNIFDNLKQDGYFCLNIPTMIYDVCVSILGEASDRIELNKKQRPNSKYTEYIYIWKK